MRVDSFYCLFSPPNVSGWAEEFFWSPFVFSACFMQRGGKWQNPTVTSQSSLSSQAFMFEFIHTNMCTQYIHIPIYMYKYVHIYMCIHTHTTFTTHCQQASQTSHYLILYSHWQEWFKPAVLVGCHGESVICGVGCILWAGWQWWSFLALALV